MKNDPLTPYGNKPMVTPIVSAVNYQYTSFEVLRQINEKSSWELMNRGNQ